MSETNTQPDTPVLLVIYKRPELTARVFAAIARARPRHLLIAADGPANEAEAARCAAARAVVEQVDWDCTVLQDYSDTNLGVRRRVTSAIDWTFTHYEEAIILEDDCVAHPTFFRYCAELLAKYRHDTRVMHISGSGLPAPHFRSEHGYCFSRFALVWGWATWRRAWQHYDDEMRDWPTLRETSWLRDYLGDETTAAFFRDVFDRIHTGKVSTWDVQWNYSIMCQEGFTIVPRGNMISNIGFGKDATNTTHVASHKSNRPTGAMEFPLRHPPQVALNAEWERRVFNFCFAKPQRNTKPPHPLRLFLSRCKQGLLKRWRAL